MILKQNLTDGIEPKPRSQTMKGLGVYAQQFTVKEPPNRKISAILEAKESKEEIDESEFNGLSLNQLKHALQEQTKLTELTVKKLAYQAAYPNYQTSPPPSGLDISAQR